MRIMLQALVKKRATEIGFDLVGIAPVDAYDGLKFSREWVERGFGGEMRYLENPKRDDPRRVLPSAQSMICVGLIYNAPLPYSIEVRRQKAESSRQKTEVRRHETEVRSQKVEVRSKKTGTRNQVGRDVRVESESTKPARNFESGSCHSLALRSFHTAEDGPPATDHSSGIQNNAWISRYAWGTDYHKIMRSKLEKLRRAVEAMAPGVETRVFVDTGPVVERAFARLSGIGWTGKNTCLINESKGSWFFIGVILTSLTLEPDLPAPDRCGTCTACIEACPTHALAEPYVMDASRCIAYLNIELKGSIPEEYRPAIGANVVGCDICQDVCPWNGKGRSQKLEVRSHEKGDGGKNRPVGPGAATTMFPEFQPMDVIVAHGVANSELRTPPAGSSPLVGAGPNPKLLGFSLFNPPLDSLASLSEEDFRRIFQKSPIKRVKYRGWLRNLCVAMGNSGESHFLPRLQYFREHTDPIVREHARWAIDQIIRANPLTAESHPPHIACST